MALTKFAPVDITTIGKIGLKFKCWIKIRFWLR